MRARTSGASARQQGAPSVSPRAARAEITLLDARPERSVAASVLERHGFTVRGQTDCEEVRSPTRAVRIVTAGFDGFDVTRCFGDGRKAVVQLWRSTSRRYDERLSEVELATRLVDLLVHEMIDPHPAPPRVRMRRPRPRG
jgi:hypothetical protein